MGIGPMPDFSSQKPSSMTDPQSDDEGVAPPATPAVQHYYSGSSSSKKPSDSTTLPSQPSNMSLGDVPSPNTMAAVLISGGPMVENQLHQQQSYQPQTSLPHSGSQNSIPPEHPSPISPAALIGMEHEKLLLPSHVTGFPRQFDPSTASWASAPGQSTQAPLPTTNEVSSSEPVVPMVQRSDGAAAQPPLPLQVPSGSGTMMGYYPPSQGPQQVTNGTCATSSPFLMAALAQPHQILSATHGGGSNGLETEEKRAKRLERNKESARRSRRKKKERLTTLEAQINKLQKEIETERLAQVETMIPHLKAYRTTELTRLAENGESSIETIIRYTGPYSSVSRAVLQFQYHRLHQSAAPSYRKFLVWCLGRLDPFFLRGKEEYSRKAQPTGKGKTTTSKISSKQVGEEMMAASAKASGAASVSTDSSADPDAGEGQYTTSQANDYIKTWPLFCAEFKVSVDQEEKILLLRKKARESIDLTSLQTQLNAAVQTVDSLRNAADSVSNAVTRREETSYLSILTPEQTAKYQVWLEKNNWSCKSAVVGHHQQQQANHADPKDASLTEISRRLSAVLKISKCQ